MSAAAHRETPVSSRPPSAGPPMIAHLDDGRTLLVHLDRNYPVDWDAGSWEIILGPGVRVPANTLNQREYVQRLRFEDRPGAAV